MEDIKIYDLWHVIYPDFKRWRQTWFKYGPMLKYTNHHYSQIISMSFCKYMQ